MKRAVQITSISPELIRIGPNGDAIPSVWPDLPPADWIVLGPRGGHYLATGWRERTVLQTDDDWMRNQWSVIDRSEGVRYIRPGGLVASMVAKPPD